MVEQGKCKHGANLQTTKRTEEVESKELNSSTAVLAAIIILFFGEVVFVRPAMSGALRSRDETEKPMYKYKSKKAVELSPSIGNDIQDIYIHISSKNAFLILAVARRSTYGRDLSLVRIGARES